jgi:TolB-like protein/AraC-like DNA-binding protein
MERPLSLDQAFIRKLTDIILSNLNNEQFGVEELSREMGMSHTTIHRRLKACKHISVSQFIREVRLQKAHEMLRQNLGTVSDISYRVGFGSPTYFNKCFHEYYGYPPGEAKKIESQPTDPNADKPDLLHHEVLQSGQDKTASAKGKWSKISGIRVIILPGITAGLLLTWLIYLIISGSSGPPAESGLLSDEKSIVVLPFKNLSTDSDNQYFADGVTVDIRDHLSQIKGLKVISGTTSEHFRGSILSIPELAEELGVSYVLEGSAQTNNDLTRVSVKLIDARHDRQLISETFDRDLSDIFSVQSEIAQIVANRLEAVLSEEIIERIERIPTKSTNAYSYYLKGRYFWNLSKNVDLLTSIEYFKKSIEADPGYAVAYAGLADVYLSMASRVWIPAEEAPGDWIYPEEAFRLAVELAQKALDMDPGLSEPHAVLGGVFASHWQWEKARKEFQKAIELNPNYSIAYFYYAVLLNILGENEEARKQLNIALELDPFSRAINHENMMLYYNQGNFHEALNSLNECKKMGIALVTYPYYFYIYLYLGEDALAYEAFLKILATDFDNLEPDESLQQMYEHSGTMGILEWLNNRKVHKTEPFELYNLSKRYAILGEIGESLDWLEKAFRARYIGMPRIYNSYDFRNLRNEPRFNALLRQMNFPEYKSRAPESD